MASLSEFGRRELRLADKVRGLQWGLIFLIAAISGLGFAMLYSAANGDIEPWASRQMVRFAVAFVPMIAAAMINIRWWYRAAYWFYGIALVLVVAVDMRGVIGMGAQRWIDLGVIQLQPSEIMKVAVVLMLARSFHSRSVEDIGRLRNLIWPALGILVPAALVMKQPDLGTALMLVLGGGVMFFLAGVRLWMFAVVFAAAGSMVPIAWRFLRPYQKARLVSFLDPESDP